MSDTDLEASVHSWLTKTGYPLEMRAARALQRLCNDWSTESNIYYTDSKTGTIREIDLYSGGSYLKGSIDISVGVICECKATERPWVVLKESLTDPASELLFRVNEASALRVLHQERAGQLSDFTKKLASYLLKHSPAHPSPGYAVSEAFRGDREQSAPYIAIRQAINAALYWTEDVFNRQPTPGLAYYAPVLLTTSPLFEAALDPSSDSVILQRTNRSAVRTITAEAEDVVVNIINVESLAEFVSAMDPLLGEIREFCDLIDPAILSQSQNSAELSSSWRY